MSDIILSVKDITKHFRHIRALDGVSAEVREGSITAIVGDNGSGKSTLIKILSGTLRPDGGSMTVCGAEHPFLTVQRAMELGIRTVYQDLSLDNCKNSVENIFLGDELMHGPFLDRRAMRLEAERLLNDIRVNVPDLSEPVRNLSGGQRQGVAIARALRRPGRLLLLDEPTAGLDPTGRRQMIVLLDRILAQGKRVVISSHDIDLIYEVCDYLYVLERGELVAQGSAQQVLLDQAVLDRAGLVQPWLVKLHTELGLPLYPNEAALFAAQGRKLEAV